MRVAHKVTGRHLHHKWQWWAAITTHQVHQLPTVGDLKLIYYLHTCSSTLVMSLGSRQMIEVFAHRSSQTQASGTQTRWQKSSIRWIKIIVTQNLAIQDKFFSAIYHLKSSLLSPQKLQITHFWHQPLQHLTAWGTIKMQHKIDTEAIIRLPSRKVQFSRPSKLRVSTVQNNWEAKFKKAALPVHSQPNPCSEVQALWSSIHRVYVARTYHSLLQATCCSLQRPMTKRDMISGGYKNDDKLT